MEPIRTQCAAQEAAQTSGRICAEVPLVCPAVTMASDTPSRPLVSIVTPAYNEKEAHRTVHRKRSRAEPTRIGTIYRNNCSTDNTLEIVQKYASSDPRIRVASNSALSAPIANFNHGLRQIFPRSKYCKILFADDRLFPNAYNAWWRWRKQIPR